MRYNYNLKYLIPVFCIAIIAGFFQLDDTVREEYLNWNSDEAEVMSFREGNTFVGNRNEPRCYYKVTYFVDNTKYTGSIGTRSDCENISQIPILIHPDDPGNIVHDGRK